MKPLRRYLAGCCAAAAGCCGVYWPVRLAVADHLSRDNSPAAAARAVRLAPGNAEHWLRWADLAAEAGVAAPGALEGALAASPRDAAVWIRAGIEAEMQGDYAAAERRLLRAAALSRMYDPRWALANYYFRRGDAARFWPWAKSALEWSWGDRRPLFDLCWAMDPGGSAVLERAIPGSPAVLRDYLGYLLAAGRIDAAEAAGRRLARSPGAQDRDSLVSFTGRMLDARRWDAALQAWNALCARGLLGLPPLDARRGACLTNADLAREPLRAGFDWRVPDLPGVSIARAEAPPALRVSFSGRQPEACEPLWQFVPLEPAASYRLRFAYQAPGIPPESGLRWRLFDAASGAELPAGSPHLAGPGWQEGAVFFTAPRAPAIARLVLAYQRMPGTTRIEGALWLRRLSLERVR